MTATRPAVPDPSRAPDTFDPTAYDTFRFVGVRIDEETATVTLRYALDDAVGFEETVRFDDVAWPEDPARRETLRRLARLLHLLAGVSYFKTAAPARIALAADPADGVADLSPRLAALLRDVYTLGLGEFAYVNQLDVRERGAWPSADPDAGSLGAGADAEDADPREAEDAAARDAGSGYGYGGDASRGGAEAGVGGQADGAEATAVARGPVALSATGRTLVPIGGGKDSVVALDVVERAGRDAVCFSVGRAFPIVGCVEASGRPHAVATRTLSPNIGTVNAAGALNGHVPVTAVVSTIALMAAVLHGADAVTMANERSASEGNLVWEGLEVNHQWSKGIAFERAFRELLVAEVATALDYRSVLRPASELAIARAFSRLERYHPRFTSCNAVFRIDPGRRASNWCGDCPKCRFVYLALAPWIEPPALEAIF
ncbi:MAG: endonuclease domain-containing protein, partial [Solirubrobacteraceae bacterium]